MNTDNDPISILLANIDTIRQGKIQAIKYFRSVTNSGLKEAKDICEAIQQGCNRSDANNNTYFKSEYENLQKRHEELKSKYNKAIERLSYHDLIELLKEI